MFQKSFFLLVVLFGLAAAGNLCVLNSDLCTSPNPACEWTDVSKWLYCYQNSTDGPVPTFPGAADDVVIPLFNESVYISATAVSANTVTVNKTTTLFAYIDFYGISSIDMLDGSFVATVNNAGLLTGSVNYGELVVMENANATISNPITDLTALDVEGTVNAGDMTVSSLTLANGAQLSTTANVTVKELLTIDNAHIEIAALSVIGAVVSISGSYFGAQSVILMESAGTTAPSMFAANSIINVPSFVASATAGQDGVNFDNCELTFTTVMASSIAFIIVGNNTVAQTMTFASIGKVIAKPAVLTVDTITVTNSGFELAHINNANISTINFNGSLSDMKVHDSYIWLATLNVPAADDVEIVSTANIVGLNNVNFGENIEVDISAPISVSGTMSVGAGTYVLIDSTLATWFGTVSLTNASIIEYEQTPINRTQHRVGTFAYGTANTPFGTVTLTSAWLQVLNGAINMLQITDGSTFGVGSVSALSGTLTVEQLGDNNYTANAVNVHATLALKNSVNPLFSTISLVDAGTLSVEGAVMFSTLFGGITEINGTLIVQPNALLTTGNKLVLSSVHLKGGVLASDVDAADVYVDAKTVLDGNLNVRNSITLNQAVLIVNETYTQADNASMIVTFPTSKAGYALLQVAGIIVIGETNTFTSTVDSFADNNKKNVQVLLATAQSISNVTGYTLVNGKAKDDSKLTISTSPASNGTLAEMYINYARSNKSLIKQGAKNSWKWIVIGVVGGVVVIAAMIVIIRRYRKRHHYQEV